MDKQKENITFPRTSYAGGNELPLEWDPMVASVKLSERTVTGFKARKEMKVFLEILEHLTMLKSQFSLCGRWRLSAL